MGSHDDESTKIKDLVEGLHGNGKLPAKHLEANTILYRIQGAKHSRADHFSAPSEDLGRYNDPDGIMKVWYGAEHPTGALAETFGKEKASRRALGPVFSEADLASCSMCEVKVTRDLKLLNLNAALSKLQIRLDEITGPEYALTQEIVRTVSRLSENKFDGIAYKSRHHPDEHMCYALWIAPDDEPTVSEGVIKNLLEYTFYGYIPEIDDDQADAEEMLTEILGIDITMDP